jgi:hypothetical protein
MIGVSSVDSPLERHYRNPSDSVPGQGGWSAGDLSSPKHPQGWD